MPKIGNWYYTATESPSADECVPPNRDLDNRGEEELVVPGVLDSGHAVPSMPRWDQREPFSIECGFVTRRSNTAHISETLEAKSHIGGIVVGKSRAQGSPRIGHGAARCGVISFPRQSGTINSLTLRLSARCWAKHR